MRPVEHALERPKAATRPPDGQVRMARTARAHEDHEIIMVHNMMSNHTNIQDNIVATATTFTRFKANTKESTKEVPRPPQLLAGGLAGELSESLAARKLPPNHLYIYI